MSSSAPAQPAPAESARRVENANACARKAQFTSRREAMQNGTRFSVKNGGTIHSYHCTSCDFWHITSMPKAASRRLRKKLRMEGRAF